MSVFVNQKICDNAKECSGIAACPTGALFWDKEEARIRTDNNLCISCGVCVRECPVGAIQVAETEAEYLAINKSIEQDQRTIEELFVERYGAMPIEEDKLVDDKQMESLLNRETLLFVEQFKDSSIQCLLHSIPVSVLINRYGGTYIKQQIDEDVEGEFPCLIIYREGKIEGQIKGYYEEKDVDVLFQALNKILKR